MTNAQFCDVHPDEKGSLIRNGKVFTITIDQSVDEIGSDGKKTRWTKEAKFHMCSACAKNLLFDRMVGLNVELDWNAFRLTQKDGKYVRVNKDINELPATTETPLSK